MWYAKNVVKALDENFNYNEQFEISYLSGTSADFMTG